METEPRRPGLAGGLLYGLAAYGLWGLLPLYFREVRQVAPVELLAHRIVWSALLLAVVLALAGKWRELIRRLRPGKTLLVLLGGTVFLAANWLIYIYSIASGQVLQASLGYFMLPLLNILLGLVFFRERLRAGQWLAVAVAGVGLAVLVAAVGCVPWVALALAGTFGLYGVLRKIGDASALVGLSLETFLLVPLAAPCLLVWTMNGSGALAGGDLRLGGLLLLSGVVTAVPLLCFGQAARRLPLTTLGFLQYLTPGLQFVLALLVFREPLLPGQRDGFLLIWAALALFVGESVLAARKRRAVARADSEKPQRPRGAEPEKAMACSE